VQDASLLRSTNFRSRCRVQLHTSVVRDAGVVPSEWCTVSGLPPAPAPTHSAPPAQGGADTPVRQGTRQRLTAWTRESGPRGDGREARATGSGITTTTRAAERTRTTNEPTSRTNATARAFTTPDPTSAVRTTSPSSPDPPPAPRVVSTAHPPAPHILTRHPSSAALGPDAAAPPPAHPLPPGLTHPGLPGRSRKHPTAGRRPVALRAETHRAKQMERNTRRETGCGTHAARLCGPSTPQRRAPRTARQL
jgi:hypothetical protein